MEGAQPALSREELPSRSIAPLLGTVCLLIGLINIAGAVWPRFRHSRLHELAEVLPGAVSAVATAGALVVGILLVLLAHGLNRRKRRAWRAAVLLLSVNVLLDVARRHAMISAIISALFLTALVVYRDEFYALSDPRTRWRALWNLLGMGAVAVVLGLAVVSAHDDIIGNPSLADRLTSVFYGFVGLAGPVRYTSDRTSDLVLFSLVGLGLVTAITSAYLFLRPERPAATLAADDEKLLRAMIDERGERDSLAYFALRRDKSVIFSESGKAAVTYRVVNGVMLASGDPIGDVEAWPGAIRRFVAEARRHAWVPAVMGCSEVGGTVWTRETGLSAWEIGDEAIVDAHAFSLEGRSMRNVRQMVSRIRRAGYSTRVRRMGELNEAERVQIRRVAAQWRTTGDERGFSMALGRLTDPADDACLLVTAHDETGEPRAFLHFTPWGTDGASLDIMRRDRSADPGLNELMVVAAIEAAPGFGIRRVSLNFAAFRAALERGDRLGAGPVLRAWRGFLLFLSRWLQIESLYRFNAKFQPGWQPRFLVFPHTHDLPRILFATLRVEGLLTLGWPGLRLIRRTWRAVSTSAPAADHSL
jgi:lysyl-tRNA synthetase, class II